MKKILLALSVVFLAACSSNDDDFSSQTKDDEVKYPVTFSVTNFSTEVQDLRSESLSEYDYLSGSGLKSYYLLIANEDSLFVETFEKTNFKDLSSLKNFELKLPKGNYTAYSILYDNVDPKGGIETALADCKGRYVKNRPTVTHGSRLIKSYSYTLNGTTYTDTLMNDFCLVLSDNFYKKTDFKVTDQGAVLKETLPRIVGKVEFYFTDAKPLDNSVYSESVYYAYVSLKDGANGINLRTGDAAWNFSGGIYLTRKQWGELATKPLSFYLRDTENATLEVVILDPSKRFERKKPLKDALATYTIPNVKVVENKKTIMKGALEKTSNFKVDIDDKWDGEINVDF